jgi:uncharacterized membrane protein
MKRPERITQHTKTTTADHIATVAFWGLVLGYPLLVLVWRLMN